METKQYKKLSVINNWLFKKIFAAPANKRPIIHLIEDILGLEVKDLEILNPFDISNFRSQNAEELQYTECDVCVRLDDNTMVVVEVQREPQKYFMERAVYYNTRAFGRNHGNVSLARMDQKLHGWKFSSLRPTYALSIIDFNYFADDRAFRKLPLCDPISSERLLVDDGRHALLSPAFLELRKPGTGKIKMWQDCLLYGIATDDAPEYIKEIIQIADYANWSEEERYMFDQVEKAREDAAATRRYAMEQSRKEGIEQGILQTVKDLLQVGVPTEQIRKGTGLTEQQIQALQ